MKIFDFATFCEPLTGAIKANTEAVAKVAKVAKAAGLETDYIRKNNFRKEDRIQQILAERGDHPGLVWVFSALESCASYRPWREMSTGRCFLKPRDKIEVQMMDNAFIQVGDCARAQQLASEMDPAELHQKLDEVVKRYVPILEEIQQRYRWSLETVEYATDIVFRRQADLQAIYENLTRTAIHTVKPGDIATFLGRRLTVNGVQEMGNRYNVRIEGTRIRHQMARRR